MTDHETTRAVTGQPAGDRSSGVSEDPDGTGGWVVRSEERARVAFPVRVRARVRLVKRVVTEEVTQTFTLRREELHVEELPGDEPGTEPSWTEQVPDEGEQESFDIVLHQEQIVPTTVVVPVERIRVTRRVVATDALVSTEIRHEQLEVDQDLGVAPTAAATAAAGGAHDEQTGTAEGGPRNIKEEPA